jgi:hypothetical protein
MKNTRRKNRHIEYRGRCYTAAELDALFGFPRGTITGRLSLGWSLERATSLPVGFRSAECKKH